MDIDIGKRFFEQAYKLGEDRVKVGLGWPIKGVDETTEEFFKIIKKQIVKGKILDLGCGEGRVAIYFAQHGFSSYGIDFAKLAIKRAKKFAEDAKVGDKTEFRVGNVLDLPYPNNFFDIAADYSVFDHVLPENWELYMKNLMRVLKKDGFYILAVFSKNTEFIKNHKEKCYFSGDAYFHFFDKEDINRIFGKYFKILKIVETRSKFPPPFLFYNVLMRKRDKLILGLILFLNMAGC